MLFKKKKKKEDSDGIKWHKAEIENLKLKDQIKQQESEKTVLAVWLCIMIFLALFFTIISL